ncbi:hypothetical protein CEN46_26145 [Fischerella thermalis CCMEE 5318]|uniref:Uncharacterized protein n=1 Tax=Fischerella thermalis CCMEE 5318 TaxID=2019666 RepID=A0A2N6L3Y9_9CYAN|nr:hypothetical protein CEN46_26145 [Fischerella thermalis CCMEE 5318]PMB21395.1 hypothetical protein CEN47_20810 [Fischerella thermalis CCMEE 5319]
MNLYNFVLKLGNKKKFGKSTKDYLTKLNTWFNCKNICLSPEDRKTTCTFIPPCTRELYLDPEDTKFYFRNKIIIYMYFLLQNNLI